MDRITSFLWNPESVEKLFLLIAVFLAVGTAWVSALKFYFEIRELVEDISSRFIRRSEYKVKRTILKAIAKDNQTHVIKLQTLRVFKSLRSIEIDESPELTDLDDPRYLYMSGQYSYSIPGVMKETRTHKLRVDFQEDEAPKAREDYTYVTSHVLNGTMQDFWGNPGIEASKPVGSESLAVEFFCAPNWCLKKNSNGTPDITVYSLKVEKSTKKEDRLEVPAARIVTVGGSYTFDEKEGPIDWFRVAVKKPPQNTNVYVNWIWDDKTQQLYRDLEAAKAKGSGSPPSVEPARQ
jgi:hypothetical protein